MAWLTPALTDLDVRLRFRVITTSAVPSEVAEESIVRAEARVRPRIEAAFPTGADTNASVRALVIDFACAYVFRSMWAIATFSGTAGDFYTQLMAEALAELDELAPITDATLTGVEGAAMSVTNAGETSGVYSYGRPEGWPEPSDTIAPDTIERRTF